MQKAEYIASRLEAISALAKVLAQDVRQGSLWKGELDDKLREIASQLQAIERNR